MKLPYKDFNPIEEKFIDIKDIEDIEDYESLINNETIELETYLSNKMKREYSAIESIRSLSLNNKNRNRRFLKPILIDKRNGKYVLIV